jgi:hypothetical protein
MDYAIEDLFGRDEKIAVHVTQSSKYRKYNMCIYIILYLYKIINNNNIIIST